MTSALSTGPSDYAAIVATPLGKLGLCIAGKTVTQLNFLASNTLEYISSDPLARVAEAQLQAYFCNPQARFTLPLAPRGTPFQQRIWQALRGIPAGSTVTYGTLAKQLETGPRAIGGACRANPLPIFIPCHRVIAQHGLGGYSGTPEGASWDAKAWLLQHEAKGTNSL